MGLGLIQRTFVRMSGSGKVVRELAFLCGGRVCGREAGGCRGWCPCRCGVAGWRFCWLGGLLHGFLVFFESSHKTFIEMCVPGEHSAKWNDEVTMVAITQNMEGGHIIAVGW